MFSEDSSHLKFLIQLSPGAEMALSENLLSQSPGLFGTVTSASSLGDISHLGYASPTAQCYGLCFFSKRDGWENGHTPGGSMLTTSSLCQSWPQDIMPLN